MTGFMDITKLADLMRPAEEESESDDDSPKKPMASMGPGQIGAKKSTASEKVEKKPQSESKDIWTEDEVQKGSEYDDTLDPRPQPEYDIIYKQAVTSEDMFLGMGNKSPATSSCEDMVIKIILPGTKMADVNLDVKEKFVDCRTPKYKLGLHLPHPVDQNSGKAQWDGKTDTLSVTLRMKREYDFMNF